MRRPVNASERLALRSSYIPKGARLFLEHENGSALFVYETAGKFYAIAFWGTSMKPMYHYAYSRECDRTSLIDKFRDQVNASVAYRAKRKTEASATVNTLKVGDILNTSWGYDQTNVDFFIVTRATKSSVWVRQIASDSEATGFMCGRTWPAMPIRMVGEETMHRAKGGYCSINGHSASLTTGDCYESSYA